MFRFAHIEVLWLLVTIPFFVAAYWAYSHRKRRQLELFGDPELMLELDVSGGRSTEPFGSRQTDVE